MELYRPQRHPDNMMKKNYSEKLDICSEFQQSLYKQGEKDRERTGDKMSIPGK